ncbi:hypothetical protein [Orientia tsutsugamushi]|uniref:hypothetical protein n=1 Tax=Orientia tsutsugamushi TaxID=784 RepID=UPI000A697BB1|nr:hypothetical protein [Orientia tsutsugamushi]
MQYQISSEYLDEGNLYASTSKRYRKNQTESYIRKRKGKRYIRLLSKLENDVEWCYKNLI